MSGRQRRLLPRNYALAVIASVGPFLLIVLALAVFQFTAQRAQLLLELEDDAIQHNVLLGGILKSVRDHVRTLASWQAHHLARADGRLEPEGLSAAEAFAADAFREGGARLITPMTDGFSQGKREELAAAHELLGHMHLAHQAMPYLRWSFYIAGDGAFMTLFPVLDLPDLVGGERPARTAALLDLLLADDALGSLGTGLSPDTPFWTPAYLDPASDGWVVTHAAPVEVGGDRDAIVGTTVLLDFLTGFLRAFDYACGRLWLVNDQGQVLAASEDPAMTGLGLLGLSDILPGSLRDMPAGELLAPGAGFRRLHDTYVLTQPVGSTPWTFLFMAQAGEVNAVILPRFVPYGIILVGLILILLLAQQLRERLIIRPALQLVDFIRAESSDRPMVPPDLPPFWQSSVDAVALAFAAERASQAEIARQRAALFESERRFRTIAAAHPVPMYILRRSDRRILYASERLADLIGLPLEQVYASFSLEFYPQPEDRDRIARALREDRTLDDAEVELRRADGTSFPAALTARMIDYEGEAACVFGIVDLSRQKEVEALMARHRDALHQSEKLNALGSMLASVAHELNNPLSVVVGYATMMRDLAPDAPTRDRAVRIHAAAERCARIVRTFLAMARRKPESRDALRIEQVIDAALEIAGYGLRTTDVQVSVDLAPDLPDLIGDADQLTLVIMNLIVNAQHALQSMPPPRRLDLTVRAAGGEVVIEVADNGPGIGDAVLDRIFEPFFTTKPQGIGTGIGLSVCRNIVLAHDGRITVATPAAGGTVFRICLPAGRGAAPIEPVRVSRPAPATGRILIVEDEAEISDMLKEMLERDGHEVDLATSGREALARLEAAPVDLIISDLHMPDLDGPELYRRLVARHPELASRMVFMTGDVLAADVTGFLGDSGVPVFDKPIDPYDIRIKVRARLEQTGSPA